MRLLFSFFLFLSGTENVWSAACCGGGISVPTIITSDDRAQLAVSYATSQVVIDSVDKEGYWHRWSQHQETQTVKLEGAQILADRWQWGLSLPVVSRSFSDFEHSGLGDISSTLSYEYLPDWNYNPYRPRGIGFVQITIPTSKSRAESELGGLDSLGNGFWALGVGTMLVKSWRNWDAFAVYVGHRSSEKNISRSGFQGQLRPGFGQNLSLGLGYNWRVFRVGVSVSHTQEQSVRFISSVEEAELQGAERWAAFSASFGYMQSEEWSWVLSYSDQTLIGDPINTSLGQSLMLQLQKRWAR